MEIKEQKINSRVYEQYFPPCYSTLKNPSYRLFQIVVGEMATNTDAKYHQEQLHQEQLHRHCSCFLINAHIRMTSQMFAACGYRYLRCGCYGVYS